MKKALAIVVLTCICFLIYINACWSQTSHSIGFGGHYWITLEDIDESDIDEDGLSWILSYQYIPSVMLRLEGDLEIMPNGYAGSDETVFAPQIYALLGSGIYGGFGFGFYLANGEFSENPFFALRAGFNLELLPAFYLDINANYRFEKWDMGDIKEDVDTDTVTLGALIRLEFF